ncbi:MAG: hypothetical protein HN878_01665 [Candidatus Diapherotrites archaeon]|jgi:hypothetical protein|nr:hypothetical protein [Candidatus Diapherotrites archaeon]
MNKKLIDKIYSGLTTKEKFDICKELIESDVAPEQAGPEIDKVKSTLNSIEYSNFQNYAYTYLWTKFKEKNNNLIIQHLWKNYFKILANQQARAILLLNFYYEISFLNKSKKIIKLFNDWFKYYNKPENYLKKINLEKKLLKEVNLESQKKYDFSIDDLFEIEIESRNEIKSILAVKGLWKEKFNSQDALDFVNSAITKICEEVIK